MKTLIYFPTLVIDFIRAQLIPNWIFIPTYAQSSEEVRRVEEQARNAARLVDYYIKRSGQ